MIGILVTSAATSALVLTVSSVDVSSEPLRVNQRPPLQARPSDTIETTQRTTDCLVVITKIASARDELNTATRWLADQTPTPAVQQARIFMPKIEAALRNFEPGSIKPLGASLSDEDGSVSLEWRFPDRRLAFIFDSVAKESGWHFVSSIHAGGIRALGGFSSLDLRQLLAWTLDPSPR